LYITLSSKLETSILVGPNYFNSQHIIISLYLFVDTGGRRDRGWDARREIGWRIHVGRREGGTEGGEIGRRVIQRKG